MLPRAAFVTAVCVLASAASIGAAQYKVVIKRLDSILFTASGTRCDVATIR